MRDYRMKERKFVDARNLLRTLFYFIEKLKLAERLSVRARGSLLRFYNVRGIKVSQSHSLALC